MADDWNSPLGRKIRMRCWTRDAAAHAPCIWCGAPIDYGKGPYRRGGDVWAWSPEHVKPRDKYPELTFDMANIAAAHWHCNASRKKKAGLTNLGKASRKW